MTILRSYYEVTCSFCSRLPAYYLCTRRNEYRNFPDRSNEGSVHRLDESRIRSIDPNVKPMKINRH